MVVEVDVMHVQKIEASLPQPRTSIGAVLSHLAMQKY